MLPLLAARTAAGPSRGGTCCWVPRALGGPCCGVPRALLKACFSSCCTLARAASSLLRSRNCCSARARFGVSKRGPPVLSHPFVAAPSGAPLVGTTGLWNRGPVSLGTVPGEVSVREARRSPVGLRGAAPGGRACSPGPASKVGSRRGSCSSVLGILNAGAKWAQSALRQSSGRLARPSRPFLPCRGAL